MTDIEQLEQLINAIDACINYLAITNLVICLFVGAKVIGANHKELNDD